MLGVLQYEPEEWFKGEWFAGGAAGEGLSAALIEAMIVQRREARARKDFAEADRIRGALADQGVILEDGAGGTVWKRG